MTTVAEATRKLLTLSPNGPVMSVASVIRLLWAGAEASAPREAAMATDSINLEPKRDDQKTVTLKKKKSRKHSQKTQIKVRDK